MMAHKGGGGPGSKLPLIHTCNLEHGEDNSKKKRKYKFKMEYAVKRHNRQWHPHLLKEAKKL